MQKRVPLVICAVILLLIPSALVWSQSPPDPTFSDFPAKKVSIKKITKPDVSKGRARTYRTRLREGAAKGPNFAGHYTVVRWGCGTDCIEFAIVDAIGGGVFFPDFLPVQSVPPYNEDNPTVIPRNVEFRLDRRLLIVTGTIEKSTADKHFFEWTGKELKLVLAYKLRP
ncbi:MAG: hypothetical protein AB1473_02480 [Thermodesulfobacteriota bacterium]